MSSEQSQGSAGGRSEGLGVRAETEITKHGGEETNSDYPEEATALAPDTAEEELPGYSNDLASQTATKRLLAKNIDATIGQAEKTLTGQTVDHFDEDAPAPDATIKMTASPALADPVDGPDATIKMAAAANQGLDPTNLVDEALSQNFDEATHIVEDDELAEMRVDTSEVDITENQPLAAEERTLVDQKSPVAKATDDSPAAQILKRAKAKAAKPPATPKPPVVPAAATPAPAEEMLERARELRSAALEDADDNTDDVTDVTVSQIPARLDPSEILAPRMEEIPETAVGIKAAPDNAKLASSTTEKLAALSKSGSRTAVVVASFGHVDASLAEMVRSVRPRPPTRLAAFGSSVVLVMVMGLWLAGDPSESHGKGEPEVATSATAGADRTGEVVAIASEETPVVEETPPSADDEAREAARKKAAEKAEREAAELAALEAAELEEAKLEEAGLEEAERLEAERLEADRLEAERLEAERLEAERLEAERLEAERLAAEKESEVSLDAATQDTGEKEVVAPKNDSKPKNAKPKKDRAAAEALYKKASMSFLQGKLGASERGFKNALKADSTYAMSYRGLGLVYERRGSKTKAASAFRRYLKLAPKAKDAKMIRARLSGLGR